MSRRKRQSLSPTLFPFLAVLVCTLGTLILLLALVAQNTSETARRIAESPPESEPESETGPPALTVGQVGELIEEEEFRLTELVSFRDAQTADLESRRDKLAHVEDHMRRIRERLDQLSDNIRRIRSSDDITEVSEQQLKTLRMEVDQQNKKLKELELEKVTGKPRVVIVPHRGPNGTNRRPIYVECTSEGATIWPEGVKITKWQLMNSSERINPLDDALRAARYHVTQFYGDSVPPYPMLVVRPGGEESYFAARAAMKDWDDQFGYELLESDVDLATGRPDVELKKRLEYAITTATDRMTQSSIARSLSGRRSRSGVTPNRIERATGRPVGSGVRGQSAAPSRQPGRPVTRLSARQLDRERYQNGFGDHRELPQMVYGRGTATSNTPGTGINAAATRRLEQRLEESAVATGSLDPDRALDQATETAFGKTAGASGDGGSGESGESTYSLGADAATDPRRNATTGPIGSVDGSGAFGKPRNGSPDGPTGAGGSTVSRTPGDDAPSASASRTQAAAQQQARGQQSPGEAPSQASPANTAMQPPPQNLVRPQGVDWALPDHVAGARGNEIVRPIAVQVYSDRIILLPDSATRMTETFPIVRGDLNQASLRMATAVRDRVTRWGATMPGGRWSPVLRVDVMPGASDRFVTLQQLLRGSGLQIQANTRSNTTGDRR